MPQLKYRITHWYCPNFGLLDGYQNDHLSPQFFFLWDLWHTMMLDYRPFFSHIQCLGAVHGFWSFYYGWKGPCLGVFPILQYKRPQGEEGFFLEISNLGWTVSYTGCREAGWIQKARRRRSGNWLDSNADALNGEKQGSDFCDVSCTICVPGIMKIGENWRIWILLILCTRGHENWRKLKHLIFMKFRAPGVMKVGEN